MKASHADKLKGKNQIFPGCLKWICIKWPRLFVAFASVVADADVLGIWDGYLKVNSLVCALLNCKINLRTITSASETSGKL